MGGCISTKNIKDINRTLGADILPDEHDFKRLTNHQFKDKTGMTKDQWERLPQKKKRELERTLRMC